MPTSEPGEVQTHPETGEPFVSKPAGGLGGGVTSFASTPATEEEHLASLESEVMAKEAEIADLKQRHGAVSKSHDRRKAEQADTDEKAEDDGRASNRNDERKRKADAVVAAADEKRRKENEAKAAQSSDRPKSGNPERGQQSNQSSSRNP